MRLGEGAKMQASINVTPLVDVVLVLLIIFMVMAPQMRKGPEFACRKRRSQPSRATREAGSWSRSTRPAACGSMISWSPASISAKFSMPR